MKVSVYSLRRISPAPLVCENSPRAHAEYVTGRMSSEGLSGPFYLSPHAQSLSGTDQPSAYQQRWGSGRESLLEPQKTQTLVIFNPH